MTGDGKLSRDYLPRDLRGLLDEAASLISWAQAFDDQPWPRPPVAVTLALVEKAGDVVNRVVWSWDERRDAELAAAERPADVAELRLMPGEPPPPDHPDERAVPPADVDDVDDWTESETP